MRGQNGSLLGIIAGRGGYVLFPTLATMTRVLHLLSCDFTRRQLFFLLLLGALAGCGGIGTSATIVSPAQTLPKDKRVILTFDGSETEEGRLESLRGVRDDGYACWLFPSTFSAAVCLQVGVVDPQIGPYSSSNIYEEVLKIQATARREVVVGVIYNRKNRSYFVRLCIISYI